jgi:hypothetical protein
LSRRQGAKNQKKGEITMNNNYSLEKITGDNRRPGMPPEGFIVRYDLGDSGWKKAKIFETSEEAEKFIAEEFENLEEIIIDENFLKYNRVNFNFDDLDFADWEKPNQTVYIEFVRCNAAQILNLGEFEALRRWILSRPDCYIVPVTPETSHLRAREFYKNLKKEQKEKGFKK